MKKLSLTALWIAALTALSAVTAFADVVYFPQTAEPEGRSIVPVLIAAAVFIAAAVIVWMVLRNRKK